MPDASDSPKPLDLSDLRLMPQWVAEFSKAQPDVAPDSDEEGSRPQRGRDRDDNRGRSGGSRFGGGNDRGRSDNRGPRPDAPRGERKPFDKPFPPREGGGGRRDYRGPPRGDRRDGPRGNFGRRDDRGPRPDAPPPGVRGLTAHIEPEPKGVEAMAHMIRTAGKAYSVFDAARAVLASGDRFHVKLTLAPESSAKFTLVKGDGSVFLSRDEAMAHLLQSDLLDHFYRVEQVELEEPKGNFTSIAICGMTGALLGPPSHHAYQTALHKIHRERFSNMPFEDYKRRVRTDSTPEAVEKWKESQKHGTHWVDIITPAPEGTEPQRFKSRTEMENDFRKRHAEPLLSEATEAVISGAIPKNHLSPALYNALRRSVDDARAHLLATAQQLCTGFEQLGLKLFKRRGGKLWVSRIRPRALDAGVVLSDRIAKMLEVVKAHPGISVKKLIETIAPGDSGKIEVIEKPQPKEDALPIAKETSVIEATTEDAPAHEIVETAAEDAGETTAEVISAPAAEAPAPAAKPAAMVIQLSPEQVNVLKDLHWLNSEGYVIEYADGIVFIGVTDPPPAKPKPVKAAPVPVVPAEVPAEKTGEASGAEATVENSAASVVEEPSAEAS